MARARDLATLRSAFDPRAAEPARHEFPPGVSAVLIPIFDGADGPEVLYTRRSDAMRSHPGEISFPGGRIDPEDGSPLEAALREAEEEVGIRPSDVDMWGHVTDFLTHHGTLICTYAAHVPGPPPTQPASLDEVSAVFTVPLDTLLDPASYEARRVDSMAHGRRVHYWHVRPQTVWGITGELTARFLERACHWAPPHPARTISDLSHFRPTFRLA